MTLKIEDKSALLRGSTSTMHLMEERTRQQQAKDKLNGMSGS
jgi:hypothetical protein